MAHISISQQTLEGGRLGRKSRLAARLVNNLQSLICDHCPHAISAAWAASCTWGR